MILQELINYLESQVPLNIQESYDNCGLLTGEPSKSITKTLISLDCTSEIIEEAIQNNCNLIICHHPIVFKGLLKFSSQNYIGKTIIKAIQNNIAIYVMHTNLDKVENGVSYAMAKKLQLENITILAPEAENIGLGAVGQFKTAITHNQFLNLVKNTFHNTPIRYTNFIKDSIQKVALCGGSGSFLLQNAITQKADVYISSDFKYHQFFDANNEITIVDIGHYEAENVSKEIITAILLKKFPTFAFCFSKINTNPVNYY